MVIHVYCEITASDGSTGNLPIWIARARIRFMQSSARMGTMVQSGRIKRSFAATKRLWTQAEVDQRIYHGTEIEGNRGGAATMFNR